MKNLKKINSLEKLYENKNYEKANYTGITKILYTINHKLMELGVNEKNNEHILDVGGGGEPHIKYMNKKKIKSYTILDSKKFKNSINKLANKNKKIKFYFFDYKKSKIYNNKKKYTRIVSSHSFEHFDKFESSFIKLIPLIKKEGLISVALPCDPGFLWRCLQFISYFKQKKIYGWKSFKEKDLIDSRDHINPVQNILKVIRYYFKKIKTIYFPFILPIIGINIFLIVQIKIKEFTIK